MLILMRPKVHKNLKRSSMKFLVQVAVAFKQKGLRILLGSIFHQISFLKFYSFFRSILIGVFFFFFFYLLDSFPLSVFRHFSLIGAYSFLKINLI